MLEKFLFSKIEIWLVALILILGSIGIVAAWFFVAFTVVEGYEKDRVIGKVSSQIAGFPWLVRQAIRRRNEHEVPSQRWPNRPGGFDFQGRITSPNYILLSRFDGNVGFNVTEFIREGETKPVARWVFDKSKTYAYEPRSRFNTAITEDPATMRATHPHLDTAGNLAFHFDGSPLYRIDACSRLIWRNDDFAYHHSLELDADGNYWIPGHSHTPLKGYGFDQRLVDDHLVKVSPDGKTLFSKSVIGILIDNQMLNRIYAYSSYMIDPIHLNDVQPVLTDGPHWKRGDVFLSLSNMNMLMLYRPGENKLLWWAQDLIMAQHDIDILDDKRIAVFNNNRTTRARGPVTREINEELVFDLATGQVTSPWLEAFRKHDIRTDNQGLADFGPDGSLLIEETRSGRLVKLAASGDTQWEYLNKSADGKQYVLNWSRYIESAVGEKIAGSLTKRKCNEQ